MSPSLAQLPAESHTLHPVARKGRAEHNVSAIWGPQGQLSGRLRKPEAVGSYREGAESEKGLLTCSQS